MSNEKTWRTLGEIVSEIKRLQDLLGPDLTEATRQPSDIEPSEIITRIERKILSRPLETALIGRT